MVFVVIAVGRSGGATGAVGANGVAGTRGGQAGPFLWTVKPPYKRHGLGGGHMGLLRGESGLGNAHRCTVSEKVCGRRWKEAAAAAGVGTVPRRVAVPIRCDQDFTVNRSCHTEQRNLQPQQQHR